MPSAVNVKLKLSNITVYSTYISSPRLDFANFHKLVDCFTPKGLTRELAILCNFCSIDRLEGDIRLSPNIKALVAEGVRKKENRTREPVTRGAVSNKIYLWTNGRVPYIIDSDFGEHEEFSRTFTVACLVRAL